MMKIGICDDESAACEELENLVRQYMKLKGREADVDVFYSGASLLEALESAYYDLLLLDIEMRGHNGVTVGGKIREDMKNDSTQILFISSRKDYAMELFDIRPLNFLLKPVSREKLYQCMDKAVELIFRNDKTFVYRTGGGYKKCKIRDIMYFESIGRKTDIVFYDRRETFYGTLKEIYEELKEYRFFYCHKSLLVNYDNVAEFYYDKLLMANNVSLEIGQRRRKAVREIQQDWELRE